MGGVGAGWWEAGFFPGGSPDPFAADAVIAATLKPTAGRSADPLRPDGYESVTLYLPGTREGDPDAVGEIARRLLPRVLRVVERELKGIRAADAECVADSVFVCLWKQAAKGAFGSGDLTRSEELWAYLMRVTDSKVTDYARRRRALKRDVGRTRGEDSVWHKTADDGGHGFDTVPGRELCPEERAAFAETFEEHMAVLPDQILREIVTLRMEKYTVGEIADRLNTSPRTVKRKLALIRDYWQGLDD